MKQIRKRPIFAVAMAALAVIVTSQATAVVAAVEPMPIEQQMRIALQAYIDHFKTGDGKRLAALFADNARIEDPVGGTRIVEGRAALQSGATEEEIMEAIWVAAEMRAGGAYAHSALALDTIANEKGKHSMEAP